jgi:hypothetical protein
MVREPFSFGLNRPTLLEDTKTHADATPKRAVAAVNPEEFLACIARSDHEKHMVSGGRIHKGESIRVLDCENRKAGKGPVRIRFRKSELDGYASR